MEEEKARHTPGPWVYEYGAVYQVVQKGRLNKGRLIMADRDNDRTMPTERDANVRLCAAAPELLEALEDALEVMGSWGEDGEPGWAERARLAIANARGDV